MIFSCHISINRLKFNPNSLTSHVAAFCRSISLCREEEEEEEGQQKQEQEEGQEQEEQEQEQRKKK